MFSVCLSRWEWRPCRRRGRWWVWKGNSQSWEKSWRPGRQQPSPRSSKVPTLFYQPTRVSEEEDNSPNGVKMKCSYRGLLCICRCLWWWASEVLASGAFWLGGDRWVCSGPGEQLLDRSAQSPQVCSGWRLQTATSYHQIAKVNLFFPLYSPHP